MLIKIRHTCNRAGNINGINHTTSLIFKFFARTINPFSALRKNTAISDDVAFIAFSWHSFALFINFSYMFYFLELLLFTMVCIAELLYAMLYPLFCGCAFWFLLHYTVLQLYILVLSAGVFRYIAAVSKNS